MTTKIRTAHSINMNQCEEGHCHISFLDSKGNVFAECVLDMEQTLDFGLEMIGMSDEEFEEGVPEGATVQ